ncbi:AMP-binding protein [Streptomyces sp. NBC_00564]|uniref:class I adenylate-forming enzyme family protein n=1 Tax=Streptomyces sp. NBC_00564 TaxID=2903663 RepID=UPI002FCD7160|nr:AMP-binding protein [Streptomyces sp. NBC_00564]
MLVGDIPRRNARRYPTKTALAYGDTRLSWAAVDERANRLATHLLSRGLGMGDRVLVMARNCLEWPEIAFGLAKAGLVLVPVNIRLAPDEVAYVMADSGARAGILHTDQAETFGEVMSGLEFLLEIGGSEAGDDYETALSKGRAVDPTPGALTASDIQFILYTSGTTGRAKGVVHEHRGMLAQVLDTTISTDARHSDVMLATTPFFTAGGMVRTLSWLYLGQTMVIHPRFDAESVLDEIERSRVTFTTFIPTMLQRTLRLLEEGPSRDVSSLRRISYGSAPVPVGLAARAMDLLGCDLQQRYGLTEAGGQVTILGPREHRAAVAGQESLLTSCGRETPHAEISVVGEDGEELPPGEVGEIVIRCDSAARGYWNNPEQTAQVFRPEGLWSGDLGRLDEDGYLHIEGRRTDMIISGGFNVYPAELERVIGGHRGVDVVAVVGVPHQEWGETPVAVVVPKGPAPADTGALQEELRALCRERLAGYKQPRSFVFRTWDSLPLGPAGKVLKRELRAQLV